MPVAVGLAGVVFACALLVAGAGLTVARWLGLLR